jgi:hypothetical protein
MAAHDVTADPRAAAPFEVLRFAVVATGADAALLELEGRFTAEAWPADHHPRLVVDGLDGRRAEVAATTAVGGAREGFWRAGFAVPLAALDARGFAVALPRLLVELPVPDVVGDGAPQLVRLAREANALRRDLDAALARAAAAEAPLAAARARAEEQIAAARERAEAQVARVRAEVQDELAAARAEADRERARAAEERARLEEELATALARAEEQIAGAHALGDERVAAAEAQAAEQLAALWEHVQAHNGAATYQEEAAAPEEEVTAVAASSEYGDPAAVSVADEDVTAVAAGEVGATPEMGPDDEAAVEVERPAAAADVTVARFAERPPRGAAALPPPSAPPIPPDWTRPVVVAVLVLATLAFLLVLAGALG